MKKKLWVLIMVLCLAVGLTACKSASDDVGGKTDNESKGETKNEAGSDVDPVTLTFLSWYPQEKFQPILDAFASEHPGIKIEFQYSAPVADYLEKMQVLTSTGEIPDIFYLAAENKTELIDNGYAADISNTEAISKLVDANKGVYTDDGKVYGFAPTTWVGGYFYNTQIFNELNLEEPKTWDDFLAVCDTLLSNGTRPIIERGEWFWDSFLGPFMNDYLAKNLNYHQEVMDGSKTFADGWGPFIEKWYNDLIVPGYIDEDLVSVSSQEFFSEFATGNAGMLAGHAGHLLDVRKLEPEFEVGFFPMPGTEEGVKVAYGAVDVAIGISSESKFQEQAKVFLDFIARDDIIQLYQDMNGYVIGMNGIESDVDPILVDIAQQYSEGKVNVYIPQGGWGPYGTGLQQQLISSSQQLLLQEIDSNTFIEQMQNKLKDLQED